MATGGFWGQGRYSSLSWSGYIQKRVPSMRKRSERNDTTRNATQRNATQVRRPALVMDLHAGRLACLEL